MHGRPLHTPVQTQDKLSETHVYSLHLPIDTAEHDDSQPSLSRSNKGNSAYRGDSNAYMVPAKLTVFALRDPVGLCSAIAGTFKFRNCRASTIISEVARYVCTTWFTSFDSITR